MQHGFGVDVPQKLEEICNPQRLALLVYDMQVGVLSQISNAAHITTQVGRVLAGARKVGVRVFFSRHMTLPNEAAGATQLRMRMAWQRLDDVSKAKSAFPRDSAQFQIASEVSPLPSEVVFDKITMSAFEGTLLDIALRDCGINALGIVGVAMEVGIEPTVRHAADLAYIPVLVTDACGAGNEKAAQRSLESLRFAGDAVLTEVETFVSVLERTGKTRRAA